MREGVRAGVNVKIFASDLDNTLLYPGREQLLEDRVCVERYQGREISFMSLKSHGLLSRVNKQVCFVPTTTRSLEQYRRISFHEAWIPQYALVCNGGMLLKDNRVDREWYEESLKIISGCLEELRLAAALLERDEYRSFEIRSVGGLFLFTKSRQPQRTAAMLLEGLNEELIQVFQNGSKIYAVPKTLNKGAAVQRLFKQLKGEYLIAAGDSALDIPMLEAADLSFWPAGLEKSVGDSGGEKVVCGQGELLSDRILEGVCCLESKSTVS